MINRVAVSISARNLKHIQFRAILYGLSKKRLFSKVIERVQKTHKGQESAANKECPMTSSSARITVTDLHYTLKGIQNQEQDEASCALGKQSLR